jgi:hypothetical protein
MKEHTLGQRRGRIELYNLRADACATISMISFFKIIVVLNEKTQQAANFHLF